MYHIPTTDGRYERGEEGDLRRGNKRQVEQEELCETEIPQSGVVISDMKQWQDWTRERDSSKKSGDRSEIEEKEISNSDDRVEAKRLESVLQPMPELEIVL